MSLLASRQSYYNGRFWTKVREGSPQECWPWTGYVGKGRGLTYLENTPIYPSRKAWILTHGPIENGLCVLHRCDNGLCCNPAHLYLGTRADNMIDRFGQEAGPERSARGRPSVLTHEQIAQMYALREQGATLQQCAERFGCHPRTVIRHVTGHRQRILDQRRTAKLAHRP